MAAATLATAKPAQPDATTVIADFGAMKTQQQAAWSSGNYAVVGTTLGEAELAATLWHVAIRYATM